jgi:sec-independent protein translocase protein TatB
MFDIGFWELCLIAVVALVVIGPERLPGVARTAGKWIGSARRFVSSVQADINAEVSKADELKRLLDEQAQIQSMHEILEEGPGDSDERKPVPRAKPDYVLKAIPSEKAEAVEQPGEKPVDDEAEETVKENNAGAKKHHD